MQEDDGVFRFLVALSVVICLGAGFCVQPAAAQSFGFGNLSPLVWFPSLEAEVQVRPTLVHIGSGNLSATTTPAEGGSLRDTFKLNQNQLFIDTIVRLQLSRLSIRGAYAPRDFAGCGPRGPLESRLSYSGLVLGMDFDLFQWNRSRLGIDVDYDLFSPHFTYPTSDHRSVRLSGGNAATIGFHATYNPLRTLWGVSGIAELRARWPLSDTHVTEWEIAGGIASPTTVIGSWSLMSGYRNTRLGFKEERGSVSRSFDGVFEGWFCELAYYY